MDTKEIAALAIAAHDAWVAAQHLIINSVQFGTDANLMRAIQRYFETHDTSASHKTAIDQDVYRTTAKSILEKRDSNQALVKALAAEEKLFAATKDLPCDKAADASIFFLKQAYTARHKALASGSDLAEVRELIERSQKRRTSSSTVASEAYIGYVYPMCAIVVPSYSVRRAYASSGPSASPVEPDPIWQRIKEEFATAAAEAERAADEAEELARKAYSALMQQLDPKFTLDGKYPDTKPPEAGFTVGSVPELRPAAASTPPTRAATGMFQLSYPMSPH
jgi:hypothetical protein